jgi:hypothetical protein
MRSEGGREDVCMYVCMYVCVYDNNVANVDSGDSGEKNNVNMRRHEK